MRSALEILANWAELQIREIKLGVPFKDSQAYEKLHAEQFGAWCKNHGVDEDTALEIFGFNGVTSKKETAVINYQQAAERARQWLSFPFDISANTHLCITMRPVVNFTADDGKEYTEEAMEGETPDLWSLYATNKKDFLTYCFIDLDTKEAAINLGRRVSKVYGLPFDAE